MKNPPRRGVEEVISGIRDKVNERYPQLDVEFPQILQDNIGDLTSSPEPIEINLFSQNPDLLKDWAPEGGRPDQEARWRKRCQKRHREHRQRAGHRHECRPDRCRRAPGFTPQEIELDASAILRGEPAPPPVILNARPYTIRVRFPHTGAHGRRFGIRIRNTLIAEVSTGKSASLGSVAEFIDQAGQTEILRENLQREVAVTGRVRGQQSLGKRDADGAESGVRR